MDYSVYNLKFPKLEFSQLSHVRPSKRLASLGNMGDKLGATLKLIEHHESMVPRGIRIAFIMLRNLSFSGKANLHFSSRGNCYHDAMHHIMMPCSNDRRDCISGCYFVTSIFFQNRAAYNHIHFIQHQYQTVFASRVNKNNNIFTV